MFLEKVAITENRKTINNTRTQKFGGMIAYFKLTVQFFKQTHEMFNNPIGQQFPFYKKAIFYTRLCLKSVWWVLIKPIGKAFSIKTNYLGDILTFVRRTEIGEIVDGSIKYKIKKTKTIKLLGIPFFSFYTFKLNKKDENYLFGENIHPKISIRNKNKSKLPI